MVLCQLPIWESGGEGTAKREGASPHQLTGSENLGQQFSAPGVASFSKPSSCTGGQKKNGSIPLGDRQHELQLKFRGTQMLGVYTISYKYIKCNVLKKKKGHGHQFGQRDDLSHLPLLQQTDIFGSCSQDSCAVCVGWKINGFVSIRLGWVLFHKAFFK